MNPQSFDLTFDEVLDEMLTASEEKLDAAAIAKWVNLYPQYRSEIIDFAARWALSESVDAREETSGLIEKEAFDSAHAIALKITREKSAEFKRKALAALEKEQPIKSLLEEAAATGKNIKSLAEELEISIPIVLKLENRLLEFATIPKDVITRLSEIIKRSSEAATAYLQLEQRFIQDANYKSEEQPELPPKQDFKEAVRTDPNLNEEQKRRWLG